jgi:hypothetical protein
MSTEEIRAAVLKEFGLREGATPGPWHLSPNWGYARKLTGHTDDGPKDFNVALVHQLRDETETTANAALIAAAPRLLHALIEAREKLAELRKAAEPALEVIAAIIIAGPDAELSLMIKLALRDANDKLLAALGGSERKEK